VENVSEQKWACDLPLNWRCRTCERGHHRYGREFTK